MKFATRPCFIFNKEKSIITQKDIKFEYFSGFALSQKQKNVESLHNQIKKDNKNLNILEVSTKSQHKIGFNLSAFNLILELDNGIKSSIECFFQGSKVFENNIQFKELYNKTSLEAKRFKELKTSGKLIHFNLVDEIWKLEPNTAFYDYLYIKALYQNKILSDEIINFNCFTDIEFNPKKSISTQAKSVALYVCLYNKNLLDTATKSQNDFLEIYKSLTFDNNRLNFD